MLQTVFFLLFVLISSVSCSNLQRHEDSGFRDATFPPRAELEPQYKKSTNSEPYEDHYLQRLENSLSTRREIEQYTKALPYFSGVSERLEFLRLPSVEARAYWIRDANLYGRSAVQLEKYEQLANKQDIALGMSESLVRKAWGEPSSIEVSGQSRFRNFRWRYNKEVPTEAGFISERKVVYFEAGRVVGWERE